ncbi:MAG: rubrerythrin family protein, partial [Bacteroidia bacterium]|nr:rubrerythrin family protein [Bacteroidia bacterium]
MKNNNLQTEIDAWFLYDQLAAHEQDPVLADVFKQMSEIERSHAVAFAKSKGIALSELEKPSWRAKTINRIGKIFGYDYV